MSALNNSMAHSLSRVRLFGCLIDNVSLDEAIDRVNSFLRDGGVHLYFAINVHKIVALRRSPVLLEIAKHSDLVTADGQPIVLAARLFNKPLKQRVTGIDLMQRLVVLAAERGYRIYLLGATSAVLDALVSQYRASLPGLQIVGCRDGYFSQDEEPGVADAIREARPDILFIGMSSPRKEIFSDKYLQTLQVPFVMGVGGAFDIFAGFTRRSPLRMQGIGMEWLWRIFQEPTRMWKRYLWDGVQFAAIVVRELFIKS